MQKETQFVYQEFLKSFGNLNNVAIIMLIPIILVTIIVTWIFSSPLPMIPSVSLSLPSSLSLQSWPWLSETLQRHHEVTLLPFRFPTPFKYPLTLINLLINYLVWLRCTHTSHLAHLLSFLLWLSFLVLYSQVGVTLHCSKAPVTMKRFSWASASLIEPSSVP